MFVQDQEAAHLLCLTVSLKLLDQTVVLGAVLAAAFPQRVDLLRQDKRSARSGGGSSGLTRLSCLVIATPVLFAGPRWNVITAFGE